MSQFTEKQSKIESGPMSIALLNAIAERLMSLDVIAERLANLENLYREERAEGVVEAIEKFTITSQRRSIKRLKPWFSASLINDGPNSVFVIGNTQKSFDEHEVLNGETFTLDFHRARIDDILLWCNNGETAHVRLVGTR